MRIKGLSSYLSDGIARQNPIGNTPELEAALAGWGYIPDTWGGYATRLMDHYDIEPGEAMAMLGITSEHIADPRVLFRNADGYSRQNPKNFFKEKFTIEAEKDLEIEVRRLRGVVDTIRSGYILPNPQEAQKDADALQDEINDDFDAPGVDILCIRRDALNSGVLIPLGEFVEVVLSCNVLDEESPSELAQEWIEAVKAVVEDTVDDEYDLDPDTGVNEIMLGDKAFKIMKNCITGRHIAMRRAQERWEEISPVFVARRLEEFPVISGNER